MGIASLLPTLKSISRHAHVGETYAGQVVCVDAYVWLHRGAYACSRELCEGLPTRKHVEYFLNRARTLKRANVRAIYVFDGGRLPGKANEEAQRRRNRSEALAKAKAHARQGNASAANDFYVRAVDITPEMAREVIEALAREGFESLTAPYEADAQMAYLVKNGFVAGVITEDSDLIAHGCRSVFTKMAGDGSGIEIRFEELGRNRGLSFVGFTPDMFLEMCVLSGCDYLPSLNGVGVKKAHSLIRRFKTYNKVLRHMKFEGIAVPKDYESRFVDALLTFKYSWVYCPQRREIVNLNDPVGVLDQSLIDDLPRLIGAYHPPEVARALANNEVHPMTLEAFGGVRAPHRRQHIAALAPSTSAPILRPEDACDDDALGALPERPLTSTKQNAFTSFLREKPEDDVQTYRAALVRASAPMQIVQPPRVGKSFYAAIQGHEIKTPLDKRLRRQSTDRPIVAREEALRVPDSVEKITPKHNSRLPKDISNITGRVIYETPIVQTSVKKSPYFANVKTPPKSTGPSELYAKIAKDSIDRVKQSVHVELGVAEPSTHATKRQERTPTRTTPARAAKKSRAAGTSSSRRRGDGQKRKTGNDKFWQMSLFESFAFEK